MSHAAHATFMLFRQQKMACSNTFSAVDMCDVVKIDFGDSAGMKVSQALIFFNFSFFPSMNVGVSGAGGGTEATSCCLNVI